LVHGAGPEGKGKQNLRTDVISDMLGKAAKSHFIRIF
jgi:hypothetical protein